MRYITLQTCKLADPLPVCTFFAQKMEKWQILLFLHRHSSEYNGLKNIFLEPQHQ
jgi:hypothetical protein